jgi:antitoxin component of RelBE/YafQ-DinJ toxin-antitoxin module
MENSMTGSLPNKELDRAALAAGHFEIAEQDGLPFDLDRLNKELLEKGLEPFTAMSEVLQAVKEWQTFQAQATPRAWASSDIEEKTMTDIPQEALDALMEIEAEAVAKKLGLSLVQARDVVKELWDEGELEVRPVGDDKYILCQRGGTTWMERVP